MQKTDKGDVFGSTLAIDFTFSVCIISFTHTLSTTIIKIENARKNKHVKDRKLGSTKNVVRGRISNGFRKIKDGLSF